MKLLADSNVLIEILKSPAKDLADVFVSNEIVICGVIKAEVLHGAKNDTDFSAIRDALSGLEEIDIEFTDWIEIGCLLYMLRKKGVSVPFQDAVIAFAAKKHNAVLWTRDKHFALIKENALPDLSIL